MRREFKGFHFQIERCLHKCLDLYYYCQGFDHKYHGDSLNA